ncbi:hypothetical protein FZEAL_6748 [Fusarium zealandicum]|uniref:Uncharacterized protein n=1 Tax=Fusarium zealandicum TaxID=1053134 RepID=A0A8H4XJA9_9HYPO|nr:hypothetical protein FZEAL_6748 [Fusarium zealandicum]
MPAKKFPIIPKIWKKRQEAENRIDTMPSPRRHEQTLERANNHPRNDSSQHLYKDPPLTKRKAPVNYQATRPPNKKRKLEKRHQIDRKISITLVSATSYILYEEGSVPTTSTMGGEGSKIDRLLCLFKGSKGRTLKGAEDNVDAHLGRRFTSLSIGRPSYKATAAEYRVKKKTAGQGKGRQTRSNTSPPRRHHGVKGGSPGKGELPTSSTNELKKHDTKYPSKPRDSADNDEATKKNVAHEDSHAWSNSSVSVHSLESDFSDAQADAVANTLAVICSLCKTFERPSREVRAEMRSTLREIPYILTRRGRDKNPELAERFRAAVYSHPDSARWGDIESFDKLKQQLKALDDFGWRAEAKPKEIGRRIYMV